MINKIIFKNFLSNIKNYVLFFISNTLAVTLMLVFCGMKYNLGAAIKDEGMAYALNMDFSIATIMMAIISIFLAIYAVQHYVKLRIRDYSMLKLLGIRKKIFQKIIFAEYGLGWALSFVVGLICGNIIYYVFQNILWYISPELIEKTMIGLKAYFFTLAINVGIVLVVVLIIMTRMEGKSLDAFAAGNEIKESKPKNKKWFLLVIAGLILLLVADYKYPDGNEGIFYAHIMWLIGMFLILSIGGGLLLESIRNNKKFYIKNLFKFNQLIHHYSSNYVVIFMLFVIHFFALAYLATNLAACFPLTVDRSFYPYDYIWAAQEKDINYIDSICKKYDGTVNEIPIIRVAVFNQLDQFGISASSYEKLTGKKCKLQDGQIMVMIENEENGIIINNKNYYTIYGITHIGKSKGEYISWDGSEQYGYVKTNISKIVTGNIAGQLVDGWRENWIIFQNSDFENHRKQILDDRDETSILALFNIPKQNRQEAGKEIESYVNKYGVEEFGELQSNYYDIDNLIKGIQTRTLFMLSSKFFLIITLLFSGIFVLSMKVMGDEKAMAKRYSFFKCMGMRKKQCTKCIRFEVRCVGWIPLILAILMGINYLFMDVRREAHDGITFPREFWTVWCIIVVIYISLQLLGIEIAARSTVKKVEKE